MVFILVLRIAILACIFLGLLFTITATAGKEWDKYESDIKETFGLWEFCVQSNGLASSGSSCSSINDLLEGFKRFNLIESSVKGNDCFI